jgi:hypothetical protein
MRKEAVISIRTDPKLKEALEWCAAEDNRSLTSLVEKVLKDWAAAKGWYENPRTSGVPKKPRLRG